MAAGNDDPTRTARDTSDAAVDPALDATLPSPGNTPVSARFSADETGLKPGARVGRYVVGDRLGAGGMGVVFQARDPDLDRELAIKIVLPQASGARAQERLLAEARAMAKLRHPAVVPVFDVGTTDHGVYVVMPLVAGGTLHDWLRAERRPWRAVLDKFLGAGRGLAAAHAAGLVHRDFKPRNVLLGEAGEALVADFGLAAETIPPPEDGAPGRSPQATSVAGTHGYMAPEQARGEALDARADQYSFCVSLWEGLHGERPDDAETRTRGALPVLPASRGIPSIPADRRGAPAWLLAAVARGFSPTAERRWPSMTALLAHLEARLRRPRRIAIGVGTIALVGGVAAVALVPSGDATPGCDDPRARLTGIWDASTRRRVEAAFAASKVAFADQTLARVLPALDGYAERWRTMHVAACTATHVERTQSADLLDRRMVCLDRRLGALGALAGAWSRDVSPTVVRRATDAVTALPSLGDCADTERLLAARPLPADLRTRARIAELERELDAVAALHWTDVGAPQLARARSAVAAARATEHLPLVARALEVAIVAERDAGEAVEPLLRELTRVAAETQDDHRAASAWADLLSELSERGSHFTEARALEPVAEAALVRAGSPPQLVFRFRMNAAARAITVGEHETALEQARLALAAAPTARARALANSLMAKVVRAKDGPAAARASATASLREHETVYGPDHPSTADAALLLAQIEADAGNLHDAERLTRRALTTQLRDAGTDSYDLALTQRTLGGILTDLGRYADARAAVEAAVAILEKLDHERSLALLAETIGLRARCSLAEGRRDDAIQDLERAEPMCRRLECPLQETLQMDLGTSLVAAGRDRARAVALVRAARKGWAKKGDTNEVKAAEVWLERHERR